MKHHGLGKGLAALMPQKENTAVAVQEPEHQPGEGEIMQIPVHLIIKNPDQPRTYFSESEIESLAQSIKSHGVLQPLIVSLSEDGEYVLVAGERRLLAARRAGVSDVPCLMRGELTERSRLEIAIIENVQREDLNFIDQARAYHRLNQEFGMTHEQVAKAVGKERSSVSNIMRLLDLPENIQDALCNKKIAYGQARGLLAEKNDKERQRMFTRMLEGTLSTVGVERETKKRKPPTRRPRGRQKDPQLQQYEQDITQALATPVRIKKLSDERGGTIEIDYYSNEELSALVERLVQ